MSTIHESNAHPQLSIQETPKNLSSDICKILSKIAASFGVALPSHRFEMLSENLSGSSIQELSTQEKIKEAWITLFPEGECRLLKSKIELTNYPAIWFSKNELDVRLLLGSLSDGSIISETADGARGKLNQLELANGFLLSPKVRFNTPFSLKEPTSAMDWFILAIKKRKGPFIEAIIASAVIAILGLVASFYTMQVYDRVVPNEAYSTLIVLGIGTLLAIFMELVSKYLRNRITDIACKQIDLELSGIFFGQMLSIRMDARPKTIGTFASQIRQFELVRNFMTSTTLFILADIPFVIFFIFVIWFTGGSLGFIPLFLLPVSIFLGLHARWKIKRYAEEQQKEANQKNGLLIEAIDGIEAIKSLGGEWKMLEYWKKLTKDSAEKELSIRSSTTLATQMTQSIQQIAYVLLIGVGVYEIGKGNLTMGGLMACSIISNRALSPISQIAGFIVQWEHAKVALKGLDEMMKLPIDREEGARKIIPDRCESKVRAEKINFAYIEDRFVINDITLKLNPGDRVAIIGPVGSGKSTLIKILSGLYRPSKGKIYLDEIDMQQIAPEFLRESIGYLTQDIRLFNGSLRYNLTIGLTSPSDSQILQACQETGLDILVKNHPQGLELPIYEGGRGLSGGQRQLVGLTRMLIAKPKFLLLDEPTASMDGDLENKVTKGIFSSSASDSVIVISTHKIALLSFVNRIIMMDKGKIVLDGARDEVLAKLSNLQKKSSN